MCLLYLHVSNYFMARLLTIIDQGNEACNSGGKVDTFVRLFKVV